jgi:hypothetical protein
MRPAESVVREKARRGRRMTARVVRRGFCGRESRFVVGSEWGWRFVVVAVVVVVVSWWWWLRGACVAVAADIGVFVLGCVCKSCLLSAADELDA